jgi:hypothetical protein
VDIIDKLLSSPLLQEFPPVLLDVGASGEIHAKWKAIAKYSICVAFDADDRELGFAVNETKGYKKLYIFNSLVSERAEEQADFYLTKSPYCSSLLEPDHDSLANWNFGDLFRVDSVARMKTVQLPRALREIGVHKVDWFKTDSQGTDLRIFASLGEEAIKRTLVAEFEPGIIDGYKGEDKLHGLMSFMDGRPFWMNDINVCGTQRISQGALRKQFTGYDGGQLNGLPFRTSPCWAEVSYFNSFGPAASYLDLRDHLLGWIFALIEGQHGFALDIALQGKERFGEAVFDFLAQTSAEAITGRV